jgi:hypothetical protein
MRKSISLAALLCFGTAALHAELLSEAVSAFPAQTTSLEYDALTTLRTLPNYRTLRKQYSGEGLQRAQKDLLSLGISEDQLSEVVTASGPNGFFGLLAGGFHAASAAREAARHGLAQSALDDGPVFCGSNGFCFLLPAGEDGHVFFGTLAQLRTLSDARQGRDPSLRANATFMNLISRMDPHAPVFGIAPGSEIGQWIGESIPPALSSRIDVSRLFSGIDSFGYSVKLDTKAHVALNLFCTSDQSAAVLKDTLSAASGLERAAAMAAASASLPFTNMTVSAAGRMLSVNLDAPIQ